MNDLRFLLRVYFNQVFLRFFFLGKIPDFDVRQCQEARHFALLVWEKARRVLRGDDYRVTKVLNAEFVCEGKTWA